jgi:hypothetical protein
VTIDVLDSIGQENGDPIVFQLTRNGVTNATLDVNLSWSGTASNGVDYATMPASVTFAAGAYSTNITVTPIQDGTLEPDETVIVTIRTNASFYTIGTPSNAVGILYNLGQVSMLVQDSQASESGDTASLRLYRVGHTGGVSIVYLNWGGAAINGTDYQLLQNQVQFGPEDAQIEIVIHPLPDAITEGDEQVQLTLTAGPGTVLAGSPSATFVIHDNLAPAIVLDRPAISPVLTTSNTLGLVIQASVYDDTQPDISNLVVTLGLISGLPSGVTFTPSQTNLGTKIGTYVGDARFTQVGTYVIRLTASDGVTSTSTNFTVTVGGTGQNAIPVSAGPDQTVSITTGANLDGFVASGYGVSAKVWSKVAGPGTVTFGTPNSEDTTAGFSATGVYTVRLTAVSALMTVFDEAQIVGTNFFTVILGETGGGTTVSEAGLTDTYTVRLGDLPTNNVTVAITHDLQVLNDITPIVFTPSDWNVPRTVTVSERVGSYSAKLATATWSMLTITCWLPAAATWPV